MRLAAALLTLVSIMSASKGTSAQERPRVQPTRDVTVTYRVEGAAAQAIPGGTDGPLRVSWDAAGQRLRAAPERRPQAVIVDLPRHTAALIDDAMHAVLALPVRPADLNPLATDGARFTRRGLATVAGFACVTWAVEAKRGAGTVCLTADGVALRGEGTVNGRQGSFIATSVAYGPVAADLFSPPPGYFAMNFPSLGRLR